MAGVRSRRRGPSTPEAIAAAAALRRGEALRAERETRKDPAKWGLPQMLHLTTAANVNVVLGNHARIVAANRSDAFDLLHGAGSLSDEEHRAARRLFRAWCFRAGVRDRDRAGLELEKIDGGRHDPSSMVTDAMIDAGTMIAFVLKGVGPVFAQLLTHQISPMVDEGRVVVWRAQVLAATGETDRNAQGAMLRQACKALVVVLADWDEEVRRGRARQAA
jgi:hypothetical protein